MKKIITTFVLFLFVFHISVEAQTKLKDKIYADINIGFNNIFDNNANSQLQAGIGYRINKRHGVGLSYHREIGGNVYSFRGIRGIGIDYRYSTIYGIIFKAGIGKIVDAWAIVDDDSKFVYKNSKLFTDFSLSYQIRPGFTFGFYYTFSPGITFESYLPQHSVEPYIDSDDLVYQNDIKYSFISYGLSIGYALPLKKRRDREFKKK